MATLEAAQTKEPGAAEEDQVQVVGPAAEVAHKRFQMPKLNTLNGSQCQKCCVNIFFVVLAVLAILLSIAVIVVSVVTSIATQVYDTEQSSRLVAMVILAVTGAVTISVVLYSTIAVFKKNDKPLHTAAVVLVVVAVIQALIAGLSVNVTAADEMNLAKSLVDSFKLAREDNPRHVKIWATTQADLKCCGVYGPEDYRSRNLPHYFPPNIPITCCPTYDSDKSELVQEREREICKSKKTFYEVGCRTLVLEVFNDTGAMVLGVTVCLIVLELLMSLTGAILSKGIKSDNEDADDKENE